MDNQPICMEIDTGVGPSLVSQSTFNELFPNRPLSPSSVRLRTYSGEPITVLGQIEANVQYKEQKAQLPLLVVKCQGPTLLGRGWLQRLQLDWSEIHSIRSNPLQALLDRHAPVFQEGLGELRDFRAKILVDPNAQPRFCKARQVPYALRGKVEHELTRLTQEGILRPVQFAEWAAPIVPVLKSDKSSVRICGDFKQTVNQAAKLDRFILGGGCVILCMLCSYYP